MENRIDAALSVADRDAVLQAFRTIREKLPFLIDLTVDERRALPKMGDKSYAFVQKAAELAVTDDSFLPRSFDVSEMRRDVELLAMMLPITQAVTQLNELIDDTYTQIGSEAYSAALVVYQSAKANGGKSNGAALDDLVDGLAKRFARKSKSKTDDATTPKS
ncbi:MAG: hypothetical protein H7Z37_18175 [Pyrinomonadaceae bacterium]|nr:hypothetical protein [Pyrinomonadaceae bacterium]